MERENLTEQEKLQVLESSIDRLKVNKNSHFNNLLYEVRNFGDCSADCPVVSAERYTREEATILIKEFIEEDTDEDLLPIETPTLKLDLVRYKMRDDTSYIGDGWRELMNGIRPKNLTNFYKLVWVT